MSTAATSLHSEAMPSCGATFVSETALFRSLSIGTDRSQRENTDLTATERRYVIVESLGHILARHWIRTHTVRAAPEEPQSEECPVTSSDDDPHT